MYILLLIALTALIVAGLFVLHRSENKPLATAYKVIGIACSVIIALFFVGLIYIIVKSLIHYGDLTELSRLFKH